jgi:phenylalanyl-tRNA synthetase beta chain
MRIPLSWLAECVDLPVGASADSVMAELVKIGLEEEGKHSFNLTGPIVVGQVLEFVEEEASNGKSIRWCQVRVAPAGEKAADGGADVRGIVCGAKNFVPGDKVVVTLPGAVLPGDFKIAARSTYGHVSDGMIASGRELGLSDDHDGILRLTQIGLDPKVGTDALELLALADEAAEVNVTPDRGYCFSIRGIAREYSHATKAEFRDPAGNVHVERAHGFELNIADQAPIRGKQGVSKFVLRVVRNVDPAKPTPAFMVSRLKLAGMRSISLIVDITNYVMLELGQPIHAYDLDKVSGGLTVRRAHPSESLKTLDGQLRNLSQEDLVIADSSGAIGLAGVMGGESTEVSATTTNLLIESANFEGVSIARSARRHKLPSEASKRFERGVDPQVAENAAARVVQLLEVHASGVADSLGAYFDQVAESPRIWLPIGFAEEITGVHYSANQITETLAEIGCSFEEADGALQVSPPSWRPDLKHKTDLVEEIARIIGFDKIPARLPVAPPGRGLTLRQKRRRAIAETLAATGHSEVLNYPFVAAETNAIFGSGLAPVTLANAMQEELNQMRLSLLPGLIESAKRNLSRGLTNLSIFEIGSVFIGSQVSGEITLPSASARPAPAELAKLEASLPSQPLALAALFVGDRIDAQIGRKSVGASYVDAMQAATLAARAVGATIRFEQASVAYLHPGRAAHIYASFAGSVSKVDSLVGLVGELHPELAIQNDLPRQVAVLEIDLDKLFAAAPAQVSAQSISSYPAATQDLSLVVSQEVPASQLLESVRAAAGELLEAISLVDDYRGSNIPTGMKSITFALRFRATDRTLTQAEASEARDNAVAAAHKAFGATIRA